MKVFFIIISNVLSQTGKFHAMGAGGEAEGPTFWSTPPPYPQSGSTGKKLCHFPPLFLFSHQPGPSLAARADDTTFELFGTQKRHVAYKMKETAQLLLLQAYTLMAEPSTASSEGPKQEKPLSAALH